MAFYKTNFCWLGKNHVGVKAKEPNICATNKSVRFEWYNDLLANKRETTLALYAAVKVWIKNYQVVSSSEFL